jgi:hypothetical protein
MVDGFRTNSTSLCTTGTAVSFKKDGVLALSGPVLKLQTTSEC